jgi:carbon starvation protein
MLAAIALCVATGVLVKRGKLVYAWVTGIPLAWLAIVTTTAAWQKLASPEPRMGFLAAADQLAEKLAAGTLTPEQAAVAPELIFNQRLDAVLVVFFAVILWVLIVEMLRVSWRAHRGLSVPASWEAPYQRLEAGS